MNQERLLDIIDVKALSASTDSLDISFGEISSMYPEELEIKPLYQRLFRWTETQQSQFIESLILGLPIPPIFVIENEFRKYELIDGLQRISSFLHFIGQLESTRYPENHLLRLQNCDIVKELNNLTYEDLSPALKIKVKRSYVRMQIIKKESHKRLKYDMFKRLNTGGSLLSAQEIRNSTIRLLNESFINFIQQLKDYKSFDESIYYVMDENVNQQFDDELVLRFFTLKNAPLNSYHGTLADYLTAYAEEVSDNKIAFDFEKEAKIFENTFDILNKVLPKGMIFVGLAKNKFQNQFLAFHYEAFSLGVAQNLELLKNFTPDTQRKLAVKFSNIKKSEKFKVITKNEKEKRTSGSQYLKYLKERISIVDKEIKSLFSK